MVNRSKREGTVKKPQICGIGFEEFLVLMEEFHGYRSPGLLLGGLMVDLSLGNLDTTPYLNVVTETVVCLPDAVQLLTPCTIGNGFLQVLDWGKFALTGYDRIALSGVRVWLKPEALAAYPLINRWFQRSDRPQEKPDFEELAVEILAGGKDLLACRPVRLHRALKETGRISTGICPICGESYALRLGETCPACGGEDYYR